MTVHRQFQRAMAYIAYVVAVLGAIGITVAMGTLWTEVAVAAPLANQADAFADGKAFGGKAVSGAGGTVNSGTGTRELPNFGTTAPEGKNFQGGLQKIDGIGNQKVQACKRSRAANPFAQQECDAVNFLARNSTTRKKFNIDAATDPLIKGSARLVDNPGTIPGAGSQRCRVVHEKTPASFITETCTDTRVIEARPCTKVLTVDVQMNCQPNTVFPALDMARNSIDHVFIFAKCDMQALQNTHIEMTADAFGVQGGQARNQLVRIPKDMARIPPNQWRRTVGGRIGFHFVTMHPHWEGEIRQVPVYILRDSRGCRPNSTDCAYHFYWEWVGGNWFRREVHGAGEGWATGVIGEIRITDHWDNQCQYLESLSR